MAYNAGDTAGIPTDMLPAFTQPVGQPTEAHLKTTDIVVITVSITVFFMIIFSVFFIRGLQYRRQRAMELKELFDEEGGGGGTTGEIPSIWRFVGWKDPHPEIRTACSPPERIHSGPRVSTDSASIQKE